MPTRKEQRFSRLIDDLCTTERRFPGTISLLVLVLCFSFPVACGNPAAPETSAPAESAVPDAQSESLFAIKCSQCHRLDKELIGPALRGSLANWEGDTARYTTFIRSSQTVIAGGDAYAVQLFNRWGKTIMPDNKLTDEEMRALVGYLNPDK